MYPRSILLLENRRVGASGLLSDSFQVTLYMLIQMIRSHKAMATKSTSKSFFSCMSSPVTTQLIRTRESTFTIFNGATIRFLACKIITNIISILRAKSIRYIDRVCQIQWVIREILCHICTCVNPVMSLEMRWFKIALVARRKVANKGTLSTIYFHLRSFVFHTSIIRLPEKEFWRSLNNSGTLNHRLTHFLW